MTGLLWQPKERTPPPPNTPTHPHEPESCIQSPSTPTHHHDHQHQLQHNPYRQHGWWASENGSLKKKNNDEGPNTYLHVYHNRSTVNYTVQLLPQEWSLLQTCKLISDISYSFQPSTPQAPLYWRDEHGRHSHSRSPSLLRYLTARRRAVGGVAGERWRERAQFPHPSLFLIVSWNLDQRSSGANTAIQWVAMLTSPVCLS